MKYNTQTTFDKLTTADLFVRIGIPRHQAEAFALRLPLLTPAAEPDPNGLFMALNQIRDSSDSSPELAVHIDGSRLRSQLTRAAHVSGAVSTPASCAAI